MKSISTIHPAITENTENTLVIRTPQRLIIGKPISQYASYSVMFCPLHSNIGKEQHEKHLCNPSSHYGKYGEYSRLHVRLNIALAWIMLFRFSNQMESLRVSILPLTWKFKTAECCLCDCRGFRIDLKTFLGLAKPNQSSQSVRK